MKRDIKKVIGWLIILTIVAIFYYINIMNVIYYPEDSPTSQFVVGMTVLCLFISIILWALNAINN